MKVFSAIVKAWRTGNPKNGSADRWTGARMLIASDGSCFGTISGGCLEGDVARKAGWWTAGRVPRLRVYKTTSDEDSVWDFGLGSNGVICVLLQPVESAQTRVLLGFFARAQNNRQTIADKAGEHFFGPSLLMSPFANADFYFGYTTPPQKLLVFGAGHDVISFVGAASSLGWETTVADVRSGYTKPDRFRSAIHAALVPYSGDPGELKCGSDTAVAHV